MIKSINPTNPASDQSFSIYTQVGVMTEQVGAITGDIELSKSTEGGVLRANYEESTDLYSVDVEHYKNEGAPLDDLEAFALFLESQEQSGGKR